MSRLRLSVLLVLAVSTLAAPTGASAACSSSSPLPADKRAANHVCTGLHPGVTLVIPSMKYGPYECAASFAFSDSRGNRYLAFPGRCYLDYDCLEETVEEVLPPPLDEIVGSVPVCIAPTDSELEPVYGKNGPVVKDLSGRRIGIVAYAVNKDGVDFALVRVDRKVALDPKLPFYGGPTRLGSPGSFVETYVYSPPSWDAAPNARSGIIHGGPEAAYVLTEGFLSQPTGASVMQPDGSAVGMFNGYISVALGYQTQPLGAGVERAQRRMRTQLSLMTAPLSK